MKSDAIEGYKYTSVQKAAHMQVNIQVPEETWRDFRAKVIKDGKKSGETIVKLINGFLAGEFDV
jgi:hypothetical protein